MVGVETVVTPEVQDVARQFEDLVERRDVIGLGFIAVAGSIGVSIANDVVDIVLPRLGMNPDPQTSGDFLAAGLVQLLFGAVVVTIAAALASTSSVLFAAGVALSIGSFVIGGANLFEWGQRVFGSFTETAEHRSNQGSGAGAGAGAGGREESVVADGGTEQPASDAGGYNPNHQTAATAD